MTWRVLFVCTGNVCRSPAAELVFRSLANPEVTVSSSGVGALPGRPVDPPTAAVLTRLGLDASAHRSRPFAAAQAEGADLVLTADLEQRDRVMLAAPDAFRRTFTIKEFLRAATAAPGRAGPGPHHTQVIAQAARYRGAAGRVDAAQDEIADAYGASELEARMMVSEVQIAMLAAVRLLGVARPRPSGGPPGWFKLDR